MRKIRKVVLKLMRSFLPGPIKKFLLNLIELLRRFKSSIISEIPLLFQFPVFKAEPANNIRVYDCFYLFNELDLLEIRLNILNDYVDYFVICESTITFSGLPKKLNFIENEERFKRFRNKILYSSYDQAPKSRDEARAILHESTNLLERLIAQRTLLSENIPSGEGNNHWVTEYFQKESLHKAIKDLNDDDVVYISDLDEIWNPNRKFSVKRGEIYLMKQIPYIYFLNNRSNEHWRNWTGTVVARYGTIKELSINDIRTHGKYRRFLVRKGGWHFSFQGGRNKVVEKLRSYGHQELNTPEIINAVESAIKTNADLRGRSIRFKKEEKALPEFLKINKERYSHLFRD